MITWLRIASGPMLLGLYSSLPLQDAGNRNCPHAWPRMPASAAAGATYSSPGNLHKQFEQIALHTGGVRGKHFLTTITTNLSHIVRAEARSHAQSQSKGQE